MNKAFVREPEPDGRAYCPECSALGVAVGAVTLDTHVCKDSRERLSDAAWFCNFPRCEVAYFDEFDAVVTTGELNSPVYPKDEKLPICACFGFELSDIEADVHDGSPRRIRELLVKSSSPDAQCRTLAANGRCCMPEVQRIYMKLMSE